MKRILLFFFPASARGQCLALFLLMALHPAAGAQSAPEKTTPLALSLPLACTPGADCWMVNYADHEQANVFRDYACGWRGYDGHDGSDIAIASEAAIQRGVPVLASAAGIVAGVRNTAPDKRIRTPADAKAVQDRECGNGVLLKHPDGWETQYCHLRRGSVRVRKAQRVGAGQILGYVGLSGMTEFPHVHLAVRYKGAAYDPFTGQPLTAKTAACGDKSQSLWTADAQKALGTYPVAALPFQWGVRTAAPDWQEVEKGVTSPAVLPRTAPALVLWAEAFAVPPATTITLHLTSPDGKTLLHQEIRQDTRKMLARVFAGRPLKTAAWPIGEYQGEIRFRTGKAEVMKSVSFRVE